jgi:hypothetical protein
MAEFLQFPDHQGERLPLRLSDYYHLIRSHIDAEN